MNSSMSLFREVPRSFSPTALGATPGACVESAPHEKFFGLYVLGTVK